MFVWCTLYDKKEQRKTKVIKKNELILLSEMNEVIEKGL
ncbi:hypothetical protein EMIT0210MI2_13022 [Priestia megaterium]|jgi:hypothetical protein